MRGRPPVPTALKQIRGNPGHRPMNADEPEITIAEPTYAPPDRLTPGAKEEWNRQIGKLVAARLLTEADLTGFEFYCVAVDEARVQDTKLRERGPYVVVRKKDENGQDIPNSEYVFWNPARTIRNDAEKRAHMWMLELGLTPSSRTRVAKSGSAPKPHSAERIRTLLRLA